MTKRQAAATSSGCSALARASGVSGVGRRSMSGVSVMPGRIAVARMPFAHSSSMIAWVSASTPAFDAW